MKWPQIGRPEGKISNYFGAKQNKSTKRPLETSDSDEDDKPKERLPLSQSALDDVSHHRRKQQASGSGPNQLADSQHKDSSDKKLSSKQERINPRLEALLGQENPPLSQEIDTRVVWEDAAVAGKRLQGPTVNHNAAKARLQTVVASSKAHKPGKLGQGQSQQRPQSSLITSSGAGGSGLNLGPVGSNGNNKGSEESLLDGLFDCEIQAACDTAIKPSKAANKAAIFNDKSFKGTPVHHHSRRLGGGKLQDFSAIKKTPHSALRRLKTPGLKIKGVLSALKAINSKLEEAPSSSPAPDVAGPSNAEPIAEEQVATPSEVVVLKPITQTEAVEIQKDLNKHINSIFDAAAAAVDNGADVDAAPADNNNTATTTHAENNTGAKDETPVDDDDDWASAFGDFDISESAIKRAEEAAYKAKAEKRPPVPPPPRFAGNREQVHYKIEAVHPQDHQIILTLSSEYQKHSVFAYIQNEWMTCRYEVGDYVSLIVDKLDEYEGNLCALVNQDQGMIVVHPDVLLSGTRISSASGCDRQAYIEEFIGGDGVNDAAVKGTMFHELFQIAVRNDGPREKHRLEAIAQSIVSAHVQELLACGLSEAVALEGLYAAIPIILRWIHTFVRHDPAPESTIEGPGLLPGTSMNAGVAVRNVIDIEESIWSTKYGIKGMIDVSAQVVVAPQAGRLPGQQQQPSEPIVTVAPIEFKTGRAHPSHDAQVLLYLLLMEERYGDISPDWGMLWYSSEANPRLVKRNRGSLVSLLCIRNRLAAAVFRREMPPVTQQKFKCARCFARTACTVALKGLQNGKVQDFAGTAAAANGIVTGGLDPELVRVFNADTGHMTDKDIAFVEKWDRLMHLEEKGGANRRPELWSMTGEERELAGRCLTGLRLISSDSTNPGVFTYTFVKHNGAPLSTVALAEGEHLILSVEGRHVAVARCYVVSFTNTVLTIESKRPLRHGIVHGTDSGLDSPDQVVWRVDRDEIASTFVSMRGFVYSLMIPSESSSKEEECIRSKLRRLIVQEEAPRVASEASGTLQPFNEKNLPNMPLMNESQTYAVRRVLSSEDYTLVLGYPGSGKTSAIVAMIRALVAQGKSIYLTAYTNSAVDNLLLRLVESHADIPFVRLGRSSSVHPAIRPYILGGEERYPARSTTELKQIAAGVSVFASTCFMANHPLLRQRDIDVCIVDEAGQMTVPATLGPLTRARSFVLVGDHNQLPPLVTNKEAAEGGLGQSLFGLLAEAHPEAVCELPVQYRMHQDIMTLPNVLFYKGALQCGSDAQVNACRLPVDASAITLDWMQPILKPETHVAFINTAGLGAAVAESRNGESVSNPAEVLLALKLVEQACLSAVGPTTSAKEDMCRSIGIISPYRHQVVLLDQMLGEMNLGLVEALTVDKSQGRDKDLIILSLVRSNEEKHTGALLTDWRRVNVALTRAKCKLVIIGDAETVTTLELFGKLFELCKERDWVYTLPAAALELPPGYPAKLKVV